MGARGVDEGAELTVESFLRLPEVKPALEFVDGRVVQKMSPRPLHGLLQSELSFLINLWQRSRGGGRILTECRLRLGRHVFVPDLLVYGPDKTERGVDFEKRAYLVEPPDLLIEILSPGQTLASMTRRFEHYLNLGVPVGWLVRPRKREVWIFRPNESITRLEIDGVLEGEGLLAGLRLEIREIFAAITRN